MTLSMAYKEMGVEDYQSPAQIHKLWSEKALPKGIEFLRALCDRRNLSAWELASMKPETVRDMLKKEHKTLRFSRTDQLVLAIGELVKQEKALIGSG